MSKSFNTIEELSLAINSVVTAVLVLCLTGLLCKRLLYGTDTEAALSPSPDSKALPTSPAAAPPKNAGIMAAQVYFPSSFVDHTEFEAARGAARGGTLTSAGLGQQPSSGTGFSGDAEDVNSLALSAVSGLLEAYGVHPSQVGRLEVGTGALAGGGVQEQCTKTVLMQLFANKDKGSGSADMEGCTLVSAGYGGTAALLNALEWVESDHWDGRFAVVVAVDTAEAEGHPQEGPQGGCAASIPGCGACALLVGRDAPLAVDLDLRASFSAAAAAAAASSSPEASGEEEEGESATSACSSSYLVALEACYRSYADKQDKRALLLSPPPPLLQRQSFSSSPLSSWAPQPFTAAGAGSDFFVLPFSQTPTDTSPHSSPPKHSLSAEQAFGKLGEWDAQRHPMRAPHNGPDFSYKGLFEAKVGPSTLLGKALGSAGTAGVFHNLLSLVHALGNEQSGLSQGVGDGEKGGGKHGLEGKTVTVFSCGGGGGGSSSSASVATMYQVRGRCPTASSSHSTSLAPSAARGAGGSSSNDSGSSGGGGSSSSSCLVGPYCSFTLDGIRRALDLASLVPGSNNLHQRNQQSSHHASKIANTSGGSGSGTDAGGASVSSSSSCRVAVERRPVAEFEHALRARADLKELLSMKQQGSGGRGNHSALSLPVAAAAYSQVSATNSSNSPSSAEEDAKGGGGGVLSLSWPMERVAPGAFYLARVHLYSGRRHYERRPLVRGSSSSGKKGDGNGASGTGLAVAAASPFDPAAPLGSTVLEALHAASAARVPVSSPTPAEAPAKTAATTAAATAGAGAVSGQHRQVPPPSPLVSLNALVVGVSACLPALRKHPSSPPPSSSSSSTSSSSLEFSREAFDPLNLDRLVRGENLIDTLTPTELSALVEKNVVMLAKGAKLKQGGFAPPTRVVQASPGDCVKLASFLPPVDLAAKYGVDPRLAATMDSAAQAAVAAGLEALKDAGIVPGDGPTLSRWSLPLEMRDETAVLYASSFPGLDAAVAETMRFGASTCTSGCSVGKLVRELKRRLETSRRPTTTSSKSLGSRTNGDAATKLDPPKSGGGDVSRGNEEEVEPPSPLSVLSREEEAAFKALEAACEGAAEFNPKPYEFDRKFLFKVLCLGNAQLAQVIGARGPNSQVNAACSGTTQACAMACDLMATGRASRVVVVSGDNATSPSLLPWLANGFRALGAASTQPHVSLAALPFSSQRNGMLLGAGAVGLVLETAAAFELRKGALYGLGGASSSLLSGPGQADSGGAGDGGASGHSTAFQAPALPLNGGVGGKLFARAKCRLVATQYSNSAFHGAALDKAHIAQELVRFLEFLELHHGVTKEAIAAQGVYLSHETCTHASPTSSCAFNEVGALRDAFGSSLLEQLTLVNTKGFTGHAMGVSFEDVAAVEILHRQVVPRNPNSVEADPFLGGIRLSPGGPRAVTYALRFSAGFGSHVVFALYAVLDHHSR